jgi:acyl carrier protein
LPEPDGARPGLSTEFVAPRDDVETVIAGIWSELIEVNRVGIHDGFFALGGHSLLAVRLLSRITELFGVEIPIRKLFEVPTVENLAKQLVQCGPRNEAELQKQAEIILKVGRLSDDEAARLLDQKGR